MTKHLWEALSAASVDRAAHQTLTATVSVPPAVVPRGLLLRCVKELSVRAASNRGGA